MSDAERCHVAALRILGYRFNSETELRRKLLAKKFDLPTISETIERLRREGWIDDARYAGMLVRARAARQLGRRRIARELQAAGVADSTAARAISDNVDPDSEADSLRAAASKRARILERRLGPEWNRLPESRNKLIAYLLKQGYDTAAVYEVLKEILLVDDQSDS